MPLDMQQSETVLEWISKRINGACPVCKGRSFNFQDILLLPNSSGIGRISVEPMRVIPVQCSVCSYVILLSDDILKAGPTP